MPQTLALKSLPLKRYIVLLCALGLAAMLSACGGGGGNGTVNNTNNSNTNQTDSGDLNTPSNPVKIVTPTEPSSVDLIDKALADNSITAEQALLYRLYADFGDTRLPKQFQGDDSGTTEGDSIARAADYVNTTGEANVSTETKEILATFMAPPYLKGSWWQPLAPANAVQPASLLKSSKLSASSATLSKNGWVPVAGTHVVVWYKEGREEQDMLKANLLLNEFETTIWPKLTSLMGRTPKSDLNTGVFGFDWTEEDGRQDIFLDPSMKPNNLGRTDPASWSTYDTSARVFLSPALPIGQLASVAAHEFFHAIQYSYETKAKSKDPYQTLWESTGAWAQHYVYPNGEHYEKVYAPSFMKANELHSYDAKDLSNSDLYRYGLYVFPLYLETVYGAGIVKAIWEQTTKHNTQLYAINAALVQASSSFEKEWPKFIAANWNSERLTTYVPFGVSTQPLTEEDPKELTLSGGFAKVNHPVDLPYASLAYYRVLLSDAQLRSVTFINGLTYSHTAKAVAPQGKLLWFKGLSSEDRAGISVQIYLKVNGQWQAKALDVTNVPNFSVCRDNPAGKIDEVVFMYGNSRMDASKPNVKPPILGPGMVGTNIGCMDWTGSVSLTKSFTGTDNGSEKLTLTGVTLKNTQDTSAPTPGDYTPPPYELAPNEEFTPGMGFVYKLTASSVKWTHHRTTLMPSNCTYDGETTFSMPGANPGPIFSNWTPPGNISRGVLLPSLFGNVTALTTLISATVDWRCVDSNKNVTTGTEPGYQGTDLVMHPPDDDWASIDSTGLFISGTGAQSNDPATTTGTWSFTGATR